MKLGLRLPQREGVDLQHDVVAAARTAEAAGYESLWAWERLLYPVNPLDPFAPWLPSYRQVAAPLTVLAAAAVVTSTARLGTSTMVAALHGPVQLAKTLATLDQLSGGRTIAGLSTGWATDEFHAVGVTRADRGRLLDETLDVFDAVWGPDPVNYHSSGVVIDNAYVLPKPVSKIPVMLGGGSSMFGVGGGVPSLGRAGHPRAVARIARRADGWLPLFNTPGKAGADALRSEWAQIRELAATYGRDAAKMEMVVVGNVTFTDKPADSDRTGFVGTLDQIMEDIASVKETGADELIIDLNLQDWWTSTEQMLETAIEIRERATAARI